MGNKEENRCIERIKLRNFKRFTDLDLCLNQGLNILVGDNDSGKSTILTAIELTLAGSKNRVEAHTVEGLLNSKVVEEFLAREQKSFASLPKMYVELYLPLRGDMDLEGEFNSEHKNSAGLLLEVVPRNDLVDEIEDVLKQENPGFPFDYYSISFRTFSGKGYTGYRKYLNYLAIDNTQISNEFATRSYVKTIYQSHSEGIEQHKHRHDYRELKRTFEAESLAGLNERLSGTQKFTIKNDQKSNLTTDLTLSEDGIPIANLGKGNQCFVRTKFALEKHPKSHELDVVLLEEPENHLSHGNMKKLIHSIEDASQSQLCIATHSSLLSSRLDLRKAILMNSCHDNPRVLTDLSEETASFFIKAPNNNALEFILSEKVLLVEGDAEYILMDAFFSAVASATLEESGVHVISVGGTSFKRYMELAALLKIKTAVIRDNDGDYQHSCVERYSDYDGFDYVQVFADSDNDRHTFEVAMYSDNTDACDKLFSSGRRSLSVQDYMLKNKSEAALKLLEAHGEELNVSEYIMEAIIWINE